MQGRRQCLKAWTFVLGIMSSPSSPPSEKSTNAAWDRCAEDLLIKFAAGTGASGLAALLLFKGRGARLGTIGFGAGLGTGMSATNCEALLAEAKADRSAKLQASLKQ